ncbi:hypothetical protein BKA93DRAFT_238952 [Sparassis latifolia]
MHSLRLALPPELVDLILDHFFDDDPTLIACSLTCRMWGARTRRCIFRTVTLKDAEDYLTFEGLLKESPDLGSCVRNLAIGSCDQSGWFNQKTPRIKNLPNVNYLSIKSWSATDMSHDIRVNLPVLLATVKFLRLDGVIISKEDLLHLLRASPRLSTLALTRFFAVRDDPEPATSSTARAIGVDSLKCDPSSGCSLMACLSRASVRVCIRKLEIKGLALADSLVLIKELVHAAGAHVEELTFSLLGSVELCPSAWQECTDVENFPRLTSLHIRSHYFPQTRHVAGPPLDNIPFLLSRIKPVHTRLEKVTISIEAFQVFAVPPAFYPSRCMDWSRLDQSLSNNAQDRPHLEVIFQICCPGDVPDRTFEAMVEVITGCLPMLRAMKTRLGVVCGTRWFDYPTFHGDFVDPVLQRWFS